MVATTVLVLGGAGKTGRRVAERLSARTLPVRLGSRSGTPPFDWEDKATWAAAVQGVRAAYVSYYPDLAAPGAADAIRSFTDLAVKSDVQRLVLLSGRGEPEAQLCEDIVRKSGVEWTLLRARWGDLRAISQSTCALPPRPVCGTLNPRLHVEVEP